jgi:lysine-specific demethylase 3
MDVADAINVMLYASPRNDGQPGCAVWDLFRADDADKLRKFLRKKYSATHIFTDPIHSQLFYLNADLRKELLDKHGVVSWRVYQHPASVLIPILLES